MKNTIYILKLSYMNDKFWCIKYDTEFFSIKKETLSPEYLCKYDKKKKMIMSIEPKKSKLITIEIKNKCFFKGIVLRALYHKIKLKKYWIIIQFCILIIL